jgi:PKD repeat protein
MSLTFDQIANLSGYNNATSGKHRAQCEGSIIGNGGFKLEAAGDIQTFSVNDGWQGAWFGRTNCSFVGDLGSCETGDCLAADGWGHLNCSGVGSAAPASKGEINIDLGSGIDYYDVSLVDGYNLPMQIIPHDYNPAYVSADSADHFRCTAAGCLNSSALSSCPADLVYQPNGNIVGCQDDCAIATLYHDLSPYFFTQPQVDAYCCPDATYCSPANPCGTGSTCAAWIQNPGTCKNCNATNGGIYPNGYPLTLNNSALFFHGTFPHAYSFTYDDASASYTCNSTPSTGLRTKYDITFCPQALAPVAQFSSNVTGGTAPLAVRFSDNSTGTPTTWNWSFGDGNLSSLQNPVFTYTKPGNYTVSLNVSNSIGYNNRTKPQFIQVSERAGNYTLTLRSGWNFISTPRKLATGNDTPTIFNAVNTGGHSIWQYNASIKQWKAMTVSSRINPLDGIWINSDRTMDVTLWFHLDPLSTPPAKPVYTGWNAVGFSDITPLSAKSTLLSVDAGWTHTIGYDAANQSYEVSIIKGDTGSHSETREMQPTKGYWLYMVSNGTLAGISA